MPRPEFNWITFSLDGREVSAPENAMLVDAAKLGDVEIPVFCYEPKLGQPVGACRMCLVEIEGMPKLQTACSTPVKDGMVVHTQTERVHVAQNAVVEFLLINHPLDCPVCDKGGECPLQDVTYGWGPGTSRFIEPKRHFQKPLGLSPLIHIDRERCILCYRCVRFSQEISEDYQLILQERGAHTYVSTFDGHPYVGPFTGNITELCPVGALTSRGYRFRARPWDIEGAGTICTFCPAQCNVELTVRDERVMRVLSRGNSEVDDGWLCDKGRFAYQHVHSDERIVGPLVREGTELMPASWERALDVAARALEKAGPRTAALAGGETSNEEAFLLQRLFRERLGSGNLSSRPGAELPVELATALADPALQATVADLEYAHAVLVLDCDPVDDASILDLRIRKGIRWHEAKLAVASARPTSLDPNAQVVLRHAPGATAALLVDLDAALAGLGQGGEPSEAPEQSPEGLAAFLTRAGEDLVVVYGERMLSGPDAAQSARALLNVATRLGLAGREGAGLLELPASTNGRGLREAGFAPGHGPGYAPVQSTGHDAAGIAAGLESGELSALYLLHADPLRSHPDRGSWERALGRAQAVIAHEVVMTETIREHATVVFPAEAYAEKEGTLVHPDGRVQRLRTAIGRPRGPEGLPGTGVRAGWQVIDELAGRLGLDLRVLAGPMASKQLFDAVPFYRGLTLDLIGGGGVRWPTSEAARAFSPAPWQAAQLDAVPPAPSVDGALRLGTFRSLWSSKEVEHSPILKFLHVQPVVELSPPDAQRLGLGGGDRVEVSLLGAPASRAPGSVAASGRGNGLGAGPATSVRATVLVRASIPEGSVFLAEGVSDQPANLLTGLAGDGHAHAPLVQLQRIAGPAVPEASAVPVMVTPAVEGLAEARQSAPMDIPQLGFGQSEDGSAR